MGGYRARGALATLALATVVLVAVVVAGTVSMAPLGNNWTANITGPQDRDSFEIVDGVIVPQSPAEEAPPTVVEGGQPDVEVAAGDVAVPESPTDTVGTPEVVPPGPILGPLDPVVPPVVEPTEPPVLGPNQPPVVEPTDPPVVEPTEPPVVVPTDPPRPPDYRPNTGGPRPVVGRPDGGPRPVIGRPDGHPVFQPKPKPAKHGKPAVKPGKRGKGRPVVVVLRPRGPKWRPAEPARQGHPRDADKWSRARPHPRQHAAPAKNPRRHQSVAKGPGKQRAVEPSRPRVRKGGNGHHGSVSSPPRGKSGKHGHRGHRGKGKRGRR